MIQRIRKARQRVAELYANSAAAQPGEVWTTSYAGDDFQDNYFEAYTAGEVRILGDECPVIEYQGRKVLGEADLDMPGGWFARAFLIGEAIKGGRRRVERGDTAPALNMSTWDAFLARDHAGEFLASVPNGSWVTVEYRNTHPVYAGQRNVVIGTTYDLDERGGDTGRDVGGDWVPFEQVTAVLLHDQAEVAS